MKPTLKSNLRFGWTTGTCATAASMAAFEAMLGGEFPEAVMVETPSGKVARLKIHRSSSGDGCWQASVIKDAGDDPDVTHGAEIIASLRRGESGSGVVFEGGEGVGIITKAGLPLAVGEPAINPVPRKMMREAIATLALEAGVSSDVLITLSVAEGRELAAQTWNPRLGIEGGISILGTTGVVRPFSCAAWIASIHRGIDVARANGLTHVAGSTGATSESVVRERYDLPEIALLDMGDFVGGMLKYLRKQPIPRLTIAGGFGKMVKLAQGCGDLHSARSQVDFVRLANLVEGLGAESMGLDAAAVAHANTALEVLQMADDPHALAHLVATHALHHARAILAHDSVVVDLMIIGRDGRLLAEVF